MAISKYTLRIGFYPNYFLRPKRVKLLLLTGLFYIFSAQSLAVHLVWTYPNVGACPLPGAESPSWTHSTFIADPYVYCLGTNIYDGSTSQYIIGIGVPSCPGGFNTYKHPQEPLPSCGIERNSGPPDTCGGTNPINILMGYKYQKEIDYSYQNKLEAARFYHWNSQNGIWKFYTQASLDISELSGTTIVTALRSNLSALEYSGALIQGWSADADIKERLIGLDDGQGNVTGWQLILTDDTVEEYGVAGELLSITDRTGHIQTFSYDLTVSQGGDDNPDTLDQVSDNFGNALSLAYDVSERIMQMVDPEGGVYRYAYDASGMLQYVSYPDNTSGISGSNPFGEDNPYREYYYEDTNFPTALTGITDEMGNRFATWTYDSEGRATSSQHANGAELVTLDYTHIEDGTDPRVKVTNELGKDTTYHYTTLHGVRKVTQVEGHPTANCVGANKNYTYDANGFLDTVTDWEGHVTDYDHDTRGLEIKRTEAAGTPQQRIITTQWHTDYRLPVKITEPGRVIDFTYDASGQLLERRETPITP